MSGLGPEDIDAFQRRWGDAMKAADEGVRRAEKGLPEDRLFDGANGALLAMRGVWAKNKIMEMQTAAIVELMAEIESRSADAMEASPDPMRQDPIAAHRESAPPAKRQSP